MLGVSAYLGGCFLLPPPSYPSCDEPPADADVEAARSAHAAAERFFEKYDYEHARSVWMAAYHLDCTAHRLLINIARANEKLGDEDEALRSLELYVERAGDAADPKVVEEVKARKKAKE